jgi:hypothetical protein
MACGIWQWLYRFKRFRIRAGGELVQRVRQWDQDRQGDFFEQPGGNSERRVGLEVAYLIIGNLSFRPEWNNGSPAKFAVTLNGLRCIGVVSAANSLVGSSSLDNVGSTGYWLYGEASFALHPGTTA